MSTLGNKHNIHNLQPLEDTHSLSLSKDLLTLGEGIKIGGSGFQSRSGAGRWGSREGGGIAAVCEDEGGGGGELHGFREIILTNNGSNEIAISIEVHAASLMRSFDRSSSCKAVRKSANR